MLRGRSFAVSLFSELAADMLCREIGLPTVSVILNAAGKFTLITPNTEECKKSLSSVESKINDWLLKVSFGETAMGISFIEAAPEDFLEGRFENVWTRLHGSMDRKKYQKLDLFRYGGTVSGYLDQFINDLPSPLCPFCAKSHQAPKLKTWILVMKKRPCAHFAGIIFFWAKTLSKILI